MAKQVGIIKFKGQLAGLVAYQLNGEWILRLRTSVDKKRIQSDPAFEGTRQINKEFGGASSISKVIRQSWMPISTKDKDGTLHHRLNKKILEYIHHGQGLRGQRVFDWLDIQNDFEPFNVNDAVAPDNYLNRLPQVTRNGSSLSALFNNIELQSAPIGTTHFQCFIVAFSLPDMHFDESKKEYVVAKVQRQMEKTNTTMTTNACNELLSLSIDPTNNYGIAFGISFFQEINGQMIPLRATPFCWYEIV